MADAIELDDGARIDRASQKILMRLNRADWMYTGTLQDAAELSQNGQVLYRLEQHLKPAGFVEEEKRRREMDPRRFKLSRYGAEWLEEHEAEVARPESRVETQKMAYDAMDEASSAKQSVQDYRKKLHRLKDAVKDALDEVEEDFQSHHSRLSNVESRSHSTKRDLSDVSDSVEELIDRVDALEQHHEESVNQIRYRLDEQSNEIEELREENDELRARLEVIEEELAKGPIESLLGD